MTTMNRVGAPRWLVWTVGLVALVLHGCGGGDQVAGSPGGVGSGGTGSYSAGPVSGLGSIIVNGVRYDVATATIVSEDELPLTEADLSLGQVVEVQGSDIVSGQSGALDTATATKVKVRRALVGRVTAVAFGAGAGTLTVLNQTVQINPKTVLPSNLVVGNEVAVHGFVDQGSGKLKATRVDRLSNSTADPTSPASYWVSGPVRSVSGGTGFTVGEMTFTYNLAGLPAGLVPGALAQVRFDKPAGPFACTLAQPCVVTAIQLRVALVDDSREARIDGALSAYSTLTRHGRLERSEVDFSQVSGLPGLLDGDRLSVQGKLSGGVLVASRVTVSNDTLLQAREVELHGRISACTLCTGLGGAFMLRNAQVIYTVPVPSALEAALVPADGVCVAVRGLSFDTLGRLIATDIRRDTACH